MYIYVNRHVVYNKDHHHWSTLIYLKHSMLPLAVYTHTHIYIYPAWIEELNLLQTCHPGLPKAYANSDQQIAQLGIIVFLACKVCNIPCHSSLLSGLVVSIKLKHSVDHCFSSFSSFALLQTKMSLNEKTSKNQLKPDRYYTPQTKHPTGPIHTTSKNAHASNKRDEIYHWRYLYI